MNEQTTLIAEVRASLPPIAQAYSAFLESQIALLREQVTALHAAVAKLEAEVADAQERAQLTVRAYGEAVEQAGLVLMHQPEGTEERGRYIGVHPRWHASTLGMVHTGEQHGQRVRLGFVLHASSSRVARQWMRSCAQRHEPVQLSRIGFECG